MEKYDEWQHGGDIYRNRVTYDFSVNINPLGMPKGVREAAKRGVDLSGVYPDGLSEELRDAIAAAEGIARRDILVGNGASELIYALCHGLRPKKILIPVPTFSEYVRAARACHAEILFHAMAGKNYTLRMSEDLRYKIETADMMFICNPNNPTGSLMEHEILLEILEICKKSGTALCIDECFLPFLEEQDAVTMKGYLEDCPNLSILRAFTKTYAIPGLRLGYLMCSSQETRRACVEQLPPWNISAPAQEAGIQALKDKDYLARTRAFLKQERELVYERLSGEVGRGILTRVYPPSANYIFFETEYCAAEEKNAEDAERDLKKILLQKGILIRDCSNYQGLRKGCYRICISNRQANEVLLGELHNLGKD